jgi:hypothetical protein
MASPLSDIMSRLDRVKIELRTLLNTKNVIVSCYCAPLPVVDMDEKRSEHAGHYDPTSHLYGQTAIDDAVRNLLSFFAPAGTNTFHPVLSPGIIQVKQKHMLEVERMLALMNSIKDEFSTEISTIEDSREKHETIHALFPMLMTKQVTRHINYIEASRNLISLSFSFAAKTDSKVIDYRDALDLLKDDEQGLNNLVNHANLPIYANCLIDKKDSRRNEPRQLQGGIPIVASNFEDKPIRVRPYIRKKKEASGRKQNAKYALISSMHNLYARVSD